MRKIYTSSPKIEFTRLRIDDKYTHRNCVVEFLGKIQCNIESVSNETYFSSLIIKLIESICKHMSLDKVLCTTRADNIKVLS